MFEEIQKGKYKPNVFIQIIVFSDTETSSHNLY